MRGSMRTCGGCDWVRTVGGHRRAVSSIVMHARAARRVLGLGIQAPVAALSPEHLALTRWQCSGPQLEVARARLLGLVMLAGGDHIALDARALIVVGLQNRKAATRCNAATTRARHMLTHEWRTLLDHGEAVRIREPLGAARVRSSGLVHDRHTSTAVLYAQRHTDRALRRPGR